MRQYLVSILLNLIASIVGVGAGWLWARFRNKRLRQRLLLSLHEAPAADEVAICVQVGGGGDALPDVLRYLREHQPNIRRVISYSVDSDEAPNGKLDDPIVARRIVEDVIAGLKAYGKGAITRLHFFPAGMLAYPLVVGAKLFNWGPVVVYHRAGQTYVPLYEMNKEWLQSGSNDFKPLKAWQIVQVESEQKEP